eukprot:sb/3477579/
MIWISDLARSLTRPLYRLFDSVSLLLCIVVGCVIHCSSLLVLVQPFGFSAPFLQPFITFRSEVLLTDYLQLWLMQLWLIESMSHRCIQLWLIDSMSHRCLQLWLIEM